MTGKTPKKTSTRKPAKPTKDETVEVATETVQLLLGNMMAEKDRSYYYDTYLKLVAKQKKAAADVTEFSKKAKEAGVEMGALKTVIKMEKLDPLDLATALKQQAAFMRDRGLCVQLSLYEPKYGSIESQAQKMGWDAGIAGRNPPIEIFPEQSPGHSEMMRAYNDAQAQIIMDGKNASNKDAPDAP